MSEAGPLIFILVMLVVFWLFLLRPQRAQQKQMRQLQASLAVGEEVVLSSGIFGVVRSLSDQRAEVEVAPGTVLTVARQVVVRRVEDFPADQRPADDAVDAEVDDEPVERRDEPGEGRGPAQGQV